MSVILPYQYKFIADRLGEMYAKIRDSYFKEADATTCYSIAQDILTAPSNSPVYDEGGINAEPDTTTYGCLEPGTGESADPNNADYSVWISSASHYSAPPYSVSKDLGTFFYDFANSTFTEAKAKQVASNAIGGALKKLNSHIILRMSGITTMAQYYSTYAYRTDEASYALSESQLSLFDYGGDAALSAVYFSQDFAELSAQNGVTIDSQYITP